MSMDPSLKIKGALSRHRNVLSRAERIEKLAEEGNWEEGDSVLGLAKVGHRKSHSGKKGGDEEKTAEEEAAAAAAEEGTEATAEDSK